MPILLIDVLVLSVAYGVLIVSTVFKGFTRARTVLLITGAVVLIINLADTSKMANPLVGVGIGASGVFLGYFLAHPMK